jgi:hypothetical protein
MDITLIFIIIVILFIVGSALKRITNKSLLLVEKELDHLLVEQEQRLLALNNNKLQKIPESK